MKVVRSYHHPTSLPSRRQAQVNSIRGISSAGRAPGLQPGGHRFEPGILHHDCDEQLVIWLIGKLVNSNQLTKLPTNQVTNSRCGSLTTEYPANGSFFRPHIHPPERASAKVDTQCA